MFPPAVCVDLAAERSDSGPIASGRRVEAPAKGVVAQVAESFAQGTRYDNLTILEAEVGPKRPERIQIQVIGRSPFPESTEANITATQTVSSSPHLIVTLWYSLWHHVASVSKTHCTHQRRKVSLRESRAL
jgi:hypothetical protein